MLEAQSDRSTRRRGAFVEDPSCVVPVLAGVEDDARGDNNEDLTWWWKGSWTAAMTASG